MHFLNKDIEFPPVSLGSKEGIVAIGGDLSPERLILAYKSGIFPWFDDDEPIIWWSPDPRFVLVPEEIKISKSMKQVLRNCEFEITINKDFTSVINHCSKIKRDGQHGTWITKDMKKAYLKLHEMGYAKSVETWRNGKLIGGLYGVDIGNGVFCGESMFSLESNASKAAFITYVEHSDFKLIDCQIYTNHLASLGAKDIPRKTFMNFL